MRIEVVPTAGSMVLPYLENKLVIIIDVLRATSTMVTALANGCEAILPVLTVEEAMEKRLTVPGAILGGERLGLRIEGFDVGNSPFDYAPEKIGGKRLIYTTTNGTRAIRAVAGMAPHVWLGSFLNLQSIVHSLYRQFEADRGLEGVLIICAGTEDRFDFSDSLCAGMLIDALGPEVELNDLGKATCLLYRAVKPVLLETIRESDHGKKLIALNMERDVIYCSTPNILPIVPALMEDEIIWLTDIMK